MAANLVQLPYKQLDPGTTERALPLQHAV